MLWPCCAALRCCTHCCIVADLVPGVLAVLGCKGVQLRLFLLLAQAVGLDQQLVLAQDQVAVTPTLGGSKKKGTGARRVLSSGSKWRRGQQWQQHPAQLHPAAPVPSPTPTPPPPLTLGLGREKRVPRRMCLRLTPYCSEPSGPTTSCTLSSAELPQRGQNRRPISCSTQKRRQQGRPGREQQFAGVG